MTRKASGLDIRHNLDGFTNPKMPSVHRGRFETALRDCLAHPADNVAESIIAEAWEALCETPPAKPAPAPESVAALITQADIDKAVAAARADERRMLMDAAPAPVAAAPAPKPARPPAPPQPTRTLQEVLAETAPRRGDLAPANALRADTTARSEAVAAARSFNASRK